MKNFGFGVMRLPLFDESDMKNVDYEKAYEMIKLFVDSGFSYFDTGYMYHNFYSENVLRDLLVKRFPRESFQIADKLPVFSIKNAEAVPLIFDEQLRRLGIDYFDYYLLHSVSREFYEPMCEAFGCFEFIAKKKREGKIREIGFSYHDDAELLDRILTEHPEVDFVQLQINYIDWENPSIQAKECYDLCTKLGKPVIVMEPIKGGSLVDIPQEAEKLFKDYAPDASVASWAVRYAASLDNVMMVLSGMSNMDHVEDNTSYMENFVPLCDDEYRIIDKVVDIINSSIAIPCTACGYCVDGCPVGIPIPKYFALYNADLQALNKGFSTQMTYYTNMTVNLPKASQCIGCGQCESACPQHLAIIDGLKLVAERFDK